MGRQGPDGRGQQGRPVAQGQVLLRSEARPSKNSCFFFTCCAFLLDMLDCVLWLFCCLIWMNVLNIFQSRAVGYD